MKKTLLTMAAAFALVSCSQEDLLTGLDGKGNGAVGVNTFVAQGTRGVAFNNADEFKATTNGFDLFAFESDGNQFMGTATDGTEFAYNAGWDYADKGEIKFWKQVTEGNTVDFYAVSPANTTTLNITNDAQTIDYTVADNSADQKDLMYAKTLTVDPTDETIIKNGVHIDFYHALSQIVFKAKVHEDYISYINATVAGVEIVNLQNSGTFTFADAGFGDFTTTYTPWSNTSGQVSYTAEVAAAGVEVNTALNSSEAVDLTTSSTALLLMPQEITGATLTDNKTEPTDGGTYLKVTCKVYYKGTNDTEATQIVGKNDETSVIYIPLTTTWQAGWKYIYTLVFSDDVADPVTINEDLYVGPWYEDHSDHKDLPEEQVMSYDAQNDAFRIWTAEDLATVRDYVNSDATYSIDEDGNITTVSTRAAVEGRYASANYILMADIDLSGYENWEPIGTETYPFYGTFNGKNKTISNLTINTTNDYQGLFGKIQGNSSASVVIENLNVEGNITADRYIGGIIGYVYGYGCDEQTITIENCSFTGNITSTNTGASESYEGRASTGGIIGAIYGDDGNVYIVNCRNSGSVKSSNWILGGIVGYVAGGNIIDCKNTATVNITRIDQRYAGGIAGYAHHGINIVKCCNTGNITINRGGLGCSSWYAGGILGATYYGTFNIIGCFNTAQIFAQTYETGIAEGGNNIISCYNVGKINDSGAFGAGYWGTIAQNVTTGNANYYGGSCTGTPNSSFYNGEAFSTDDYTDEITAMNAAIQEYATNCQDELIKSYLSALRYKLNEDEATKGTMPLIFE